MSIDIKPKVEERSPLVYTKLTIDITCVKIGVSADILAQLYSSDLSIVQSHSLKLEQPDYALWGTDDSFIVSWVLSQLGLEEAPPVVVEPPQSEVIA